MGFSSITHFFCFKLDPADISQHAFQHFKAFQKVVYSCFNTFFEFSSNYLHSPLDFTSGFDMFQFSISNAFVIFGMVAIFVLYTLFFKMTQKFLLD
jgi:hypothetical protein